MWVCDRSVSLTVSRSEGIGAGVHHRSCSVSESEGVGVGVHHLSCVVSVLMWVDVVVVLSQSVRRNSILRF